MSAADWLTNDAVTEMLARFRHEWEAEEIEETAGEARQRMTAEEAVADLEWVSRQKEREEWEGKEPYPG